MSKFRPGETVWVKASKDYLLPGIVERRIADHESQETYDVELWQGGSPYHAPVYASLMKRRPVTRPAFALIIGDL